MYDNLDNLQQGEKHACDMWKMSPDITTVVSKAKHWKRLLAVCQVRITYCHAVPRCIIFVGIACVETLAIDENPNLGDVHTSHVHHTKTVSMIQIHCYPILPNSNQSNPIQSTTHLHAIQHAQQTTSLGPAQPLNNEDIIEIQSRYSITHFLEPHGTAT